MSSSDTTTTTTALIGTATFLAVSVGYLVYRNEKAKASFPFGPPSHWLTGNLMDGSFPNLAKGETFDKNLLELAKQHGLVFRLDWRPLLKEQIVVCDPELVHKIMVRECPHKSYIYKELAPCLGEKSIVTLPGGKDWAAIRKTFNPGFTPAFLKQMLDTMVVKLDRFMELLEKDAQTGQATHFLNRVLLYTSDVILAVAFGEDWDKWEKHPARNYEDKVVSIFTEILMSPMNSIFGFQMKREMKHYGRLVDQEMNAILERRLADPPKEGENSKDILSLAIKHMLKEDGPLTQDDKSTIADQLKSFYFAGHDTVGATITWATWLLSQHGKVLQKVRRELQQHGIWTDPKSPPTLDQLQKCEYLQAVIHETLRLYPPATGLTRDGTKLKDIRYKGYEINTPLLAINVYVMHRHPDLWKEPDVFRPERFLDGTEGDVSKKFIPFSTGARDCIGRYFAILESKLALSKLVTRFDFECVDPNEIFDYKLTNVPKNGCQLKIRKRS